MAAPDVPPPADPGARRHLDRTTVTILVAYFAASTAAVAQVTALGKLAYDLSGREIDLGYLGLAEFIPAALLVLVTGAVADRFDRRRVAAAATLVEAAVALVLLAYAGSSPTAVGPLFILAAAFGVGRAFASPAVRSLPADTVPAASLPWLVARWSITFQAALVVGPVLAGTLYAVDVRAPFALAAALFLVAAVGFRLIPSPESAAGTEPAAAPKPAAVPGPAAGTTKDGTEVAGGAVLREAMEGLRFVRRTPILLGAISLDLFAVLFGGAVALLPAIAEERLGVGAVGFGWLRAATGLGAGVVMGILAFRPLTRRVGRTLLLAVAVFGLATIVLGLTRSYAVAFVALMVLSGADALSLFVRNTLVPLVVPRSMRGRVLAVESVFVGASNELGAFESGVAGQALGPALAVVTGGAATLVVAGVWWVVFPALRRVDRFPGAVDEAAPAARPPPL
jgi:MFS family permease